MDKKQMYVQVVNLETGKIFSLPTLYTDRTEACVCGQNYVRDRHAEDPCSDLFFRVLIAENGEINPPDSLWDDDEDELHPICDCDEDDCDGECDCCGLCNEEDSEEPDWKVMDEILSMLKTHAVQL